MTVPDREAGKPGEGGKDVSKLQTGQSVGVEPPRGKGVPREAVEDLLAWVKEQRDHCRPPGYETLSGVQLDTVRGPSAAYGAVFDLVAAHLERILR